MSAFEKTEMIGRLPTAKAFLVVHGGKADGRIFALTQAVVTVGSHADGSDFVIRDSAVSRDHIRLRRESGQYTLSDLASRNGTLVNGQPVQSCLLHDNDLIRIGNTVLVYKYVSPHLGVQS